MNQLLFLALFLIASTAGEFVRSAEGRADYQYFFGGRTCFQPIPAARNAVMTGGGCDDGKPHLRKLTASWARRQLSRGHRVAANQLWFCARVGERLWARSLWAISRPLPSEQFLEVWDFRVEACVTQDGDHFVFGDFVIVVATFVDGLDDCVELFLRDHAHPAQVSARSLSIMCAALLGVMNVCGPACSAPRRISLRCKCSPYRNDAPIARRHQMRPGWKAPFAVIPHEWGLINSGPAALGSERQARRRGTSLDSAHQAAAEWPLPQPSTTRGHSSEEA